MDVAVRLCGGVSDRPAPLGLRRATCRRGASGELGGAGGTRGLLGIRGAGRGPQPSANTSAKVGHVHVPSPWLTVGPWGCG